MNVLKSNILFRFNIYIYDHNIAITDLREFEEIITNIYKLSFASIKFSIELNSTSNNYSSRII